jgi:hypothetical protein
LPDAALANSEVIGQRFLTDLVLGEVIGEFHEHQY